MRGLKVRRGELWGDRRRRALNDESPGLRALCLAVALGFVFIVVRQVIHLGG